MTVTLAQSIDWQAPVQDSLSAVATFVPKLLAFLAILIVARIIAGVLRRAVTFLLERIKFDAIMDRAGMGAPMERAGFADTGMFVAKIVYYAVLLLGLQLAMSVFGSNPVSDLINGVIAFIPKAIVGLVIIVVTGLIVRAVNGMLEPFYANMDGGRLARLGVTGGIWMIGIFATLDQIEVAQSIVSTLFTTIMGSIGLIMVIKFGVGGVWEARDRFWPAVYDRVAGDTPAADTAGPAAGGNNHGANVDLTAADAEHTTQA